MVRPGARVGPAGPGPLVSVRTVRDNRKLEVPLCQLKLGVAGAGARYCARPSRARPRPGRLGVRLGPRSVWYTMEAWVSWLRIARDLQMKVGS